MKNNTNEKQINQIMYIDTFLQKRQTSNYKKNPLSQVGEAKWFYPPDSDKTTFGAEREAIKK